MGWVFGLDSYYHTFKFENMPNYVSICVKNRPGSKNNIEFIVNAQKSKTCA
jgi:hypothetical protein